MSITIEQDQMRIDFERFGLDEYSLFLKCKALPEYQVEFDEGRETYRLTAPARFASLLGVAAPRPERDGLPFNERMFDYQRFITKTALDARRYAVWADCGFGKAIRATAKVLTPGGWVEIQHLNIGDQVIGRNGHPCTVKGVYPQGKRQLFRVTFSDGATCDCDGDHLWYVQTQLQRYRKTEGRVLTTREIAVTPLKDKCGRRRYFIPLVEPVEFVRRASLPIDPYTLGVLLGDGHLSAVPAVTTHTSILREMKLPQANMLNHGREISPEVETWNITCALGIRRSPIVRWLKKYGLWKKLAHNKFIPEDYLFASIEARHALLQGLLDTDGYFDASGCSVQFSTASPKLAEDVTHLAQSLGGTAAYNLKEAPQYTYRGERKTGRPAHLLTIRLPERFAPFRATCRTETYQPREHYTPYRAIDRIEIIDVDNAVCIKVDAPDSLFVTESFVVTHNTLIMLEWCRQTADRTGGRGIIFSPLQIIGQTIEEARTFYGDNYRLEPLETREELARFCRGGEGAGIVNYEKLIPGVLNELRQCAFVAADEASILKTQGGTIKWNLMKSTYGVEYKLALTATPAPNDVFEYLSQAGFLDKFNDNTGEGAFLASFFTRDKSNEWVLKPHAREAFYRYMCSWSIYLRNPAAYGFKDNTEALPEPIITEYAIEPTDEQMRFAFEFAAAETGDMFASERMGISTRTKLNQAAKGFYYEGPDRRPVRIPSRKPAEVARLALDDMAAGLQVMIWTVYDEEAEILMEELSRQRYERWSASSGKDLRYRNSLMPDGMVRILSGKTPQGERQGIIDDFRHGRFPILISKASMLGYGINFQNVGSMIFSGWNDSYEQWYQAIRRALRYGQTRRLRIHIPFIAALEGKILENVRAKAARFEAETRMQEINYRNAMKGLLAA